MTTEGMGDETYIMKALLDFLGLSRSTLRYYEQIGIVRPSRDEQSDYRTYVIDDIYRVVGSYMLKNAGHSVRDVQTLTDSSLSADSFVDHLIEENDNRLAWHEAMRDSLRRLADVCNASMREAAPELFMCEPWLAFYDKGETSYKNFDPDGAMAALLASMPVSSFGSVYLGDYLAEEHLPYKSFRAIPKRFAHLVPELKDADLDRETFGGCPCVAVCTRLPYESIILHSAACTSREVISSRLCEWGFEPQYPAFSISGYPIKGSIYAKVCIPVSPATRRARRMLKSLC